MKFRQSTLNFGLHSTTTITALPPMPTDATMRLPSSSPTETDTIVVDTTHDISCQLPTPSESATDVSSESSQVMKRKTSSKSRSKRAGTPRKVTGGILHNPDSVASESEADMEKNRSISGETLVANKITTSEDCLLQKSSSFSHSMYDDEMDILLPESKADLSGQNVQGEEMEVSSVITVQEDSEDEQFREERRVAKKAKMEENARKWEARKKAAEKSATRRSGRDSLMSKANKLLENVKSTVLGKRSGNSRETDDPSVDIASKALASKKPRIGEDIVLEERASIKLPARRDKRWLSSGLYAGQPRLFDARLTENKNKRKSKTLEDGQTKDNSILPLPMFAGERLLKQGRDFKLPFDVFSPLPAGQPKPDEWKKVNRNVFVGDAASEWRTSKFVEHSTCLCNSQTRCDQDCMNRYMYYECDERNCNLRHEPCGNRAFEGLKARTKIGGKYNVGVEVIKTADRGYGVRSNRTFEANQIIVEYTGEIITQEECERRMRSVYKDNECYYLMLFDQNMIIDATRGSIARFVNHSCEPNCRMEKWTVGGHPRMALFAGDQGIMTGEELTYDYNFDPYSQKNVQECRCGAKTCRGVLGPKPKPEAKRISPENDEGKKKTGKVSSTKRKAAKILDNNTARSGKKIASSQEKKTKISVKARSGSKSPKKTVLVKKTTTRKVSVPKTTTKLGRSDSKLKKVLAGAKSKAKTLKGGRVVSSSSSTKTLLAKEKSTAPVRSTSLEERAKSVTRSIRARSTTITVAS